MNSSVGDSRQSETGKPGRSRRVRTRSRPGKTDGEIATMANNVEISIGDDRGDDAANDSIEGVNTTIDHDSSQCSQTSSKASDCDVEDSAALIVADIINTVCRNQGRFSSPDDDPLVRIDHEFNTLGEPYEDQLFQAEDIALNAASAVFAPENSAAYMKNDAYSVSSLAHQYSGQERGYCHSMMLCEQPEHERYMQEFRVHICATHNDKSCPNDSYACFDSHSKHTRRQPVLISNDEYNYAPTRCRYVQTLHGKRRCPQGDECRYAHSTEEMIYHPLVYKTQLCPHMLSSSGVCTGFGQHCAKAHGHMELRYPTPCHSAAERSFLKVHSTANANAITLATDVELGITRDSPAFYMLCYKTDRCPQKSCPRTCERFHNLKERRRCPKFFSYSEQPCPFVKSGSATKNWRDPSRCPEGDSCRYSHTLLEQMYHPNIYKTSPCNNYIEQDPSRCTWGPLCTHAHGIADMQRQGRALATFDQDIAQSGSGMARTPTIASIRPSAASVTMAAAIMSSSVARVSRQSQSPDGSAAGTTSPLLTDVYEGITSSSSDEASSSSRTRQRFNLPPPLAGIMNGNQIWQSTQAYECASFTRRPDELQHPSSQASFDIWKQPLTTTAPTWKPSVSSLPFVSALPERQPRSRSSSPVIAPPSGDLRSLLAKLEHLEVENARLSSLSSVREQEVDTWRRECRRLVSTHNCPVCGAPADGSSSSCSVCHQSLVESTEIAL